MALRSAIGIRIIPFCWYRGPWFLSLPYKEVHLPHQPENLLVVYYITPPFKLCCYASVSIARKLASYGEYLMDYFLITPLLAL